MSWKENLKTAGYTAAFAGVVGLLGVNFIGMEDGEDAKEFLENEAKLQNVEITGKAGFWECRGSTMLRTSFTAESNGEKVQGAVCETLLKPVSVRYSKAPPTKPGV